MVGNGQTVIVESPIVAKRLAIQLHHLLRVKIAVMATKGHLYDYKAVNGKPFLEQLNADKIAAIRRLDGGRLIIATDPDDQGELIAHQIKKLTPNSLHRRCVFNDLTATGVFNAIQRFNENEFQFSEDGALKAALLKMTNLNMQISQRSGLYLTTTSIALAKEVRHSSDTGIVMPIQVKHGSEIYTGKMASKPQDNKIDRVSPPKPTITADLLRSHALDNKQASMMATLQDIFENGFTSYIRTDNVQLPMSSASAIRDYACYGREADVEHFFLNESNDSHFAIHNLNFPTTSVERSIAKQNGSALDSTNDELIVIHSENSEVLAYKNAELFEPVPISPKNQLMLHLCNCKAPASTLELSAQKYSRLLFRGNSLNYDLIRSIENKALSQHPDIYDVGINEVLDRFIQKEKTNLSAEINYQLDAFNKKGQSIEIDVSGLGQ